MAILWGSIENKTMETGVDRGVLYTGAASVPWDGLVSVMDKTPDKELTNHYYEGSVYYINQNPGNYAASVEAFAYPLEFEEFQGMSEIEPGFYVDNQVNYNTFDFSYRTLIADGLNGLSAAYKIHLIYNVIATPVENTQATINESVESSTFNWDFFCIPKSLSGFRNTAHYVIDSRYFTPLQMLAIETLLYGPNGYTPSTLPGLSEISTLIQNPEAFLEVMPGVYDVQYAPPGWTYISPGVYDVTAFPSGWSEVGLGLWETAL